MAVVIDLVKRIAGNKAYANLEKVLAREWAKERAWATNAPGIQTGKNTRHEMADLRPDDTGEGLIAAFFRTKRSGINPLTMKPTKISSEGPVKAVIDETLTHRPDLAFGGDIPDSLKRALAKVRNRPNVFFADGSQL
jgi:hypothetical protein